MRQVILDTETTGIRVEDGHRVIEIGCLEMVNRKLTNRRFHTYLNPFREIEKEAIAIHGITNEFLKDKPAFELIVNEFMEFISGSELIIHNAPFDLSFLNNELQLTKQPWKSVTEYCAVVDTLQLARRMHVGQRNSLDALCKRYKVDNSKRDFHGALLDANLLAQVYLGMTGGQGSFFDAPQAKPGPLEKSGDSSTTQYLEPHQLVVISANAEELAEHASYLELLKKKGKCLWRETKIIS